MQPHESERSHEVAKFVSSAKRVIAKRGVLRSTLREVLRKLEKLAAKRHLWSPNAFPDPIESRQSILYRISEEEDRSFALYLEVAGVRRKVPPHSHTTWACVAAVEGCEDNFLYKPVRGRSGREHTCIKPTTFVAVFPGNGIVLMPKDIRAARNSGEIYSRHLHFYGRALETLTSRLQFDLIKQTARTMPPGVTTRV